MAARTFIFIAIFRPCWLLFKKKRKLNLVYIGFIGKRTTAVGEQRANKKIVIVAYALPGCFSDSSLTNTL